VTGGSVNAKFYFDFVTIKYSPTGQEEWVATYDGPANLDDSGAAITVDSSQERVCDRRQHRVGFRCRLCLQSSMSRGHAYSDTDGDRNTDTHRYT
jgi:hypothetical protein